jgi:hypothetical protein
MVPTSCAWTLSITNESTLILLAAVPIRRTSGISLSLSVA